MYDYQIIIEKSANNYSAYVPDLPGCVATGKTPDLVMKLMKKAIEIHIQGMIEDGIKIPEPTILEVNK